MLDKEKIKRLIIEKGYYIIDTLNYEDAIKEDNSLSTYDVTNFIYDKKNNSIFNIFYDSKRVEIKMVTSLTQYVEHILNIERSVDVHVYYRGHPNWKYILKPSIYRNKNINILNNEDKLLRDIVSSKPHFFEDCDTTLEKLVKMQHHGIPTRLLDLSDNPLIALFFACKSFYKERDRHAEVNIFRVPENKFKYYDSDAVSVLANISKCPIEFDVTDFLMYDKIDKDSIEKFNKTTRISELVHFVREDKPYFLPEIDPKHMNNLCLVVKPKMAIDRMVTQSGAFILFGIKKSKKICSDFNMSDYGNKHTVLIIPAIYKCKIANELKLFNVNEASVFCDMDSTARFYKDKYNG